ncbi:hypothetical protein [Telmatospirillum sp. J64-1]|uniref:hypothetical protein n=1 Tax=Telmatospirillum sp. J64-1 TaxID=2502183 RepID=UPI00115DD07E|nr:hypothetical protein [Telmatospirillum sp. J64-1]
MKKSNTTRRSSVPSTGRAKSAARQRRPAARASAPAARPGLGLPSMRKLGPVLRTLRVILKLARFVKR